MGAPPTPPPPPPYTCIYFGGRPCVEQCQV